jgi:prevent-host-death family protein
MKKSTAVTNVVSALDARTQLGQILRRVKNNRERFVINRRGEPQAVIMGLDDYIDAIAPPPAWLKRLWAASERRGTDRLSMRQINAEIGIVRREMRKRSR